MIKFNLIFTNHLKNYKHVNDLGDGAYGDISVYRCNHGFFKNCKKQFVVKQIKIKKCKSEREKRNMTKSMQHEWTIHRILNHDNIRKLIDIDLTNNVLICEYNQKFMDLFDFTEQKLFIPKEQNIDKFIEQFHSVLTYIHSLGVAHMDLKLENILIDKDYNIKIIDFGNSCVYKLYDKLNLLRGLRTTLEYASPEQFTHAYYSPEKCDLWSFGIILFGVMIDNHPWTRAIKTDMDYLNYYACPEIFLTQFNINVKYYYLLKNLLSINTKRRCFSFKNLLQSKHLLQNGSFFGL